MSEPRKLWVCVSIRICKVVEETLPDLAHLGRHFRELDRRLYCFNLAEKRLDPTALVMSPMLEQPSCFGCYSPRRRIWKFPPFVDLLANRVDDRSVVVALLLSG